jgi:predicted RNA-binding protein YlqC (UPF0109 family)
MEEVLKEIERIEKEIDDEIAFMHSIVDPLISFPDKLSIEKIIDDRGILLNVEPFDRDVGLLIGRQGCMASAIRLLMHSFGMKNKKNISVKINQPKEKSVIKDDKCPPKKKAKK